jgi:enoyl-CoA hydratase
MDVADLGISQVVLSIRETVAVVQINRPLKRNALSQDLIDELSSMLRKLNRDPAVRAVVLTSVGQTPFCGEDIESQ